MSAIRQWRGCQRQITIDLRLQARRLPQWRAPTRHARFARHHLLRPHRSPDLSTKYRSGCSRLHCIDAENRIGTTGINR